MTLVELHPGLINLHVRAQKQNDANSITRLKLSRSWCNKERNRLLHRITSSERDTSRRFEKDNPLYSCSISTGLSISLILKTLG